MLVSQVVGYCFTNLEIPFHVWFDHSKILQIYSCSTLEPENSNYHKLFPPPTRGYRKAVHAIKLYFLQLTNLPAPSRQKITYPHFEHCRMWAICSQVSFPFSISISTCSVSIKAKFLSKTVWLCQLGHWFTLPALDIRISSFLFQCFGF